MPKEKNWIDERVPPLKRKITTALSKGSEVNVMPSPLPSTLNLRGLVVVVVVVIVIVVGIQFTPMYNGLFSAPRAM